MKILTIHAIIIPLIIIQTLQKNHASIILQPGQSLTTTQTKTKKYFKIEVDTDKIRKIYVTLKILSPLVLEAKISPHWKVIAFSLVKNTQELESHRVGEYIDYNCLYLHKNTCSLMYDITSSTNLNTGKKT